MKSDSDKLREEYPPELIKSGVRGKFAREYQDTANLVSIDPDLREVFPDSASVNKALRDYLSLRERRTP
jgi:hypothetical protein